MVLRRRCVITVFLVRHGESIGNEENRWQGTADYPLSARGAWQAERVAERLARHAVAAIYSSPLGRARQTADVLGQAVGLAPRLDSRLQEYDIGQLAGLRMEEIRQQYPAVFEAMTRPGKHYVAMPGEEGARPFRARITAAWDDLLRSTSAGSIAVITHRAVMMGLISHLLGIPPEQRSPVRFYNGSISRIDVTDGRPCLRWLNDTCHLRSHESRVASRES